MKVGQIVETSWCSPAESDEELLKLIGVMTVRFNVLELYLSTLITIKMGLSMKGETYNYILEEMSFIQKVKFLGDYISVEIKKGLLKINNNRNKIIHGLFSQNTGNGKISIKYKKKNIDNLVHFLFRVNMDISSLCKKVHSIIIYPAKLEN